MSKLFERLLEVRGLDETFLHPKYEDLADPFILPDMKKAIQRIETAIKKNEKILIYGDYDVDGVTSSALMESALILAGVDSSHILIMLPDRFSDGYGMSPKLIDYAKKNQVKLVITVDCGSNNHAIIEDLNQLGINTIITDHHECLLGMPPALAVINPKRKDYQLENSSLYNLAGVGVAFKVAAALSQAGLIKNEQEKWLLDLVLIGTVCDNMVLTGENRILCYYGIKVLEKTRRRGLRELMKKAGLKKINAKSVGFQIGPRLNAAGRVETADLALSLLRSDSNTEAAMLSEKLNDLNDLRKNEQEKAIREIIERDTSTDPVIIEVGKWHEGVLGIIAGRLVEKYQKPAFVLSKISDDIVKGSGRSFGDFNLAEALNYTKGSIITGGGHAGAAGVKLYYKDLYNFREKINTFYQSLHLRDQEKYFLVHPDLDVEVLSDFSLKFLEEMKLLEPFGAGNEEPVFCLKNVKISGISRMGKNGQHLRVDVTDNYHNSLKLVAFSAPETWFDLDMGKMYNFIVQITENEYLGVRSVEGHLVGINNML